MLKRYTPQLVAPRRDSQLQVVALEQLHPAQLRQLAAAQLEHLVPQRLGQPQALLERHRPRARDGTPRAAGSRQVLVPADEPAEVERRVLAG
eukprot:CAMPEP_0182814590 /NCGR_PEP_ID=MMETSP0006_2-20121128/9937_1 /TAXON_ID=97485 /ORGANISM="Prymnesium parvum, Strain Texoma1" /LENGTH=91 /DNA_ID=CAMNT_0024940729 /DNA_START=366 /DNA_END=638 /DNA_ORIENTATION=+